MTWEQVQTRFPEQWLLIEAVVGHDEGDRYIVDDVAVMASFQDSAEAWREYGRLRRADRSRRFIPIHSTCPKLDFEVRWSISPRIPVRD